MKALCPEFGAASAKHASWKARRTDTEIRYTQGHNDKQALCRAVGCKVDCTRKIYVSKGQLPTVTARMVSQETADTITEREIEESLLLEIVLRIMGDRGMR